VSNIGTPKRSWVPERPRVDPGALLLIPAEKAEFADSSTSALPKNAKYQTRKTAEVIAMNTIRRGDGDLAIIVFKTTSNYLSDEA
jgi:hypothetical protein